MNRLHSMLYTANKGADGKEAHAVTRHYSQSKRVNVDEYKTMAVGLRSSSSKCQSWLRWVRVWIECRWSGGGRSSFCHAFFGCSQAIGGMFFTLCHTFSCLLIILFFFIAFSSAASHNKLTYRNYCRRFVRVCLVDGDSQSAIISGNIHFYDFRFAAVHMMHKMPQCATNKMEITTKNCQNSN